MIVFEEYEIKLGNLKSKPRNMRFESKAKTFLEDKFKIKLYREKKRITGAPDYYYNDEGIKKYIEIKCNNDGLRKSQLKWIMENKDKVIRIIWVEFDYYYQHIEWIKGDD